MLRSAAASLRCLFLWLALSKLRAASLDLVAFVANADAALIVAKIVDAAVNIFINNRARLKEGLFDILGGLGGSLHEDEAVLASKHLTLVGADLSPCVQVTLVSNQHDRHIRVSVLLDFLKPACKVCEGVSTGDVVDQ